MVIVSLWVFQHTTGVYISSPLKEASHNISQNTRFLVSWINTNSTSCVTSYSLRNSLDTHNTSPSASPNKLGFSTRPLIWALSSFIHKSLDECLPPWSSLSPSNRSSLSGNPKKGPALSVILSNAIPASGN